MATTYVVRFAEWSSPRSQGNRSAFSHTVRPAQENLGPWRAVKSVGDLCKACTDDV